jgi:hypothetical protein
MDTIIALPKFKITDRVIVTDPKNKDSGRTAKVISTATTAEFAAVNVRFENDEKTLWFYSDQLAKIQ